MSVSLRLASLIYIVPGQPEVDPVSIPPLERKEGRKEGLKTSNGGTQKLGLSLGLIS